LQVQPQLVQVHVTLLIRHVRLDTSGLHASPSAGLWVGQAVVDASIADSASALASGHPASLESDPLESLGAPSVPTMSIGPPSLPGSSSV
jgi:hypothetical protein